MHTLLHLIPTMRPSRIAAQRDHDKDTPRYLDDVIDIGEWTFNFPRPLKIDPVLGWRDRLRRAIDKSGKKHSVVAAEAGITRATLSRVLTATHQNPTLETIVKIARAINENVGWLLDEPSYVLSADEQRKLHDAVRVLENSLRSASRQRPRARAESNAIAVTANREIPRAFAAAGARLIYEASGDSMIGAAIADRDLLFVKPTNSIREATQKIVICRLDADEYVKYLDVRNGHIRLLSRNERHSAIDVTDPDDFELIGIVVGRAGAPVS